MISQRHLPRTFGTAGTVAIEYGMVLPVLLLFTFGAMDASRLLWTNITLSQATEAAARCGAVNTTTCPAASIPTYAATQAADWGLSNITATNFVASRPSCGVQVAATYVFTFVVPWFPQFSSGAPFGGTTLTLTATACYPLQP
jgi:Flp pilus assembly protein TadG